MLGTKMCHTHNKGEFKEFPSIAQESSTKNLSSKNPPIKPINWHHYGLSIEPKYQYGPLHCRNSRGDINHAGTAFQRSHTLPKP